MRRSTVPSLPLHLVFPADSDKNKERNKGAILITAVKKIMGQAPRMLNNNCKVFNWSWWTIWKTLQKKVKDPEVGRGGGDWGPIMLSRSRYSEHGQVVGAWAGSVCKEKGLWVWEGVERGSRDGSRCGSGSSPPPPRMLNNNFKVFIWLWWRVWKTLQKKVKDTRVGRGGGNWEQYC